MTAAERLYAEHGLSSVSNRQISEAAGQGNVSAVAYHFSGRDGLVQAITNHHGARVDQLRERHLERLPADAGLRAWVDALVRPVPEYLGSLGTPSWQARFTVQVMTDPRTRALATGEALVRPHLRHTLDGLGRRLEALPAPVRAERGDMARHLITHTCAERERAIAEGTAPLHPSWDSLADALSDALTGLLAAPVTTPLTDRKDTDEDHR
ncbi:TetR/AcrR family transcriptional regulator [Streptomyces sp. BBFR102]|uniref:TetR/AcrR family transcriptional regulator n=1 Tax=Streptomyces sp. BBFR102 TaxID=3448171 RepID=UPI003F530AB8